jgi:hypothetical protein
VLASGDQGKFIHTLEYNTQMVAGDSVPYDKLFGAAMIYILMNM